ncbi:MAG: rhodanese-like domain-containing protein [Alphaproteobacteria bacterium]
MSEQAYAGDVDVRRAWEILKDDPQAVLVDVRTKPECRYVGHPDLKALGREPVFVEWQAYPDLALNQRFADEVAAKGVAKEATLLLLCRSGARSKSAAILLTKLGYRRCYNVADGFEGAKDGAGHRGRDGGWKAAGLPWQQD